MKIAVLAVQGAFAEHAKRVQELGAEAVELRQKADVLQSYDGIQFVVSNQWATYNFINILNLLEKWGWNIITDR